MRTLPRIQRGGAAEEFEHWLQISAADSHEESLSPALPSARALELMSYSSGSSIMSHRQQSQNNENSLRQEPASTPTNATLITQLDGFCLWPRMGRCITRPLCGSVGNLPLVPWSCLTQSLGARVYSISVFSTAIFTRQEAFRIPCLLDLLSSTAILQDKKPFPKQALLTQEHEIQLR